MSRRACNWPMPDPPAPNGGPSGHATSSARSSTASISPRTRVSIVAFYTEARPVVIDTFDPEVVANILDDLPLEHAFTPGKTNLYEGVKAAGEAGKTWPAKSATLLVVSDGDTLPAKEIPSLPAGLRRQPDPRRRQSVSRAVYRRPQFPPGRRFAPAVGAAAGGAVFRHQSPPRPLRRPRGAGAVVAAESKEATPGCGSWPSGPPSAGLRRWRRFAWRWPGRGSRRPSSPVSRE